MRLFLYALCIGLTLTWGHGALAAKKTVSSADSNSSNGSGGSHIEVSADQSLEWYQDQHLYVARGNAKAVRGAMTVEADTLSAHERETASKSKTKTENPPPTAATEKSDGKASGDSNAGDIDKMTAEGHVHVTTQKSNIYGEHGVYDMGNHVAYLTGNGLKYQTPTETVTSRDSLEYWEDKKMAVARGNAVAIKGERHVEGDVLTAQFRDMPNGKSEMHTLTAEGHVVVITANDVSRGDRAVYDVSRNIAILTGNVRITRADGTQLTGDVGEVDFAANQSRLLNQGKGTRVRALLVSKSGPKGNNNNQRNNAGTPASN